MPKIEIIEPRYFAGELADEIVASISEFIEEQGLCTLVLAGGKTPASIYRLLAKPPRSHQVDWDKVFLFWGDERWVTHDNQLSNFKMSHETLISQIDSLPKENYFPVNTSLNSAAEGAKQYADTIENFFKTHPSANNKFDMVLLGVGTDGHTASLFPNDPKLDDTSTWVRAVVNPDDHTERVTLTKPAIESASRIIFIVSGEVKAEVVHRVLEGSEETSKLPAKLFARLEDQTSWFLDTASAQNLKST